MKRLALAAVLVLIGTTAALAESVPAEQLGREIARKVESVDEFRQIREYAREHGVRVWLFGGTAASFAHYVRLDLLRRTGDTRFPMSRFDYDFTNIFRSTQDADIVVDGGVAEVAALQRWLEKHFDYFKGSKENWEVRSLRTEVGDKEPLLGNPDFLHQHSDSHSTGMIELTKGPPGEHVVRDLRDWETASARFLRDVAEGKLTYYYSEKHGSTRRASAGLNPPILSAIRYFTKAFQFSLKMRGEDLGPLREVIAAFHPTSVSASTYVSRWLEKNGPKLFLHAMDVEYAWNLLEKTGLRRKLMEIEHSAAEFDDPEFWRSRVEVGSLAWWMNREPLRTQPLGTGGGRTIRQIAEELGVAVEELVVAHDTSEFLYYEALMKNPAGAPNVFISRDSIRGESAALGTGHYTMGGREGGRGTGWAVRYHPNPDAREGTDFFTTGVKRGAPLTSAVFVWTNRAALTTLYEPVTLDVLSYFGHLGSHFGKDPGAETPEKLFSEADLGIRERWLRRMAQQKLKEAEEKKLVALLKRGLRDRAIYWPPFRDWFRLPVSAKHPELLDTLLKKIRHGGYAFTIETRPGYGSGAMTHNTVAMDVFSQKHWAPRTEWIHDLVDNGEAGYYLAEYMLSRPDVANRPDLLVYIMAQMLRTRPDWGSGISMLKQTLALKHWREHPKLRRICRGEVTYERLATAITANKCQNLLTEL